MNNEENELLKLYEQQYIGRLFEKAVSYLNERNALFDERDELNKEIERLNNIIDELEKYHIESMKNLENTEDFKYVGINHIKILYEEHKRTLEKIKELKEGK